MIRIDLVTDLFQFYPPLVYYKLVESQLDLTIELIVHISTLDMAKFGDVLKEQVPWPKSLDIFI